MNTLTLAMEKLTDMLIRADGKLKGMGAEPYGQVKSTEKDQRDMYRSLTPEKLYQLIEERGVEPVGRWMVQMRKKYPPKEEDYA